jgi:exodeoxyribonuclease V alpha subunit
MPLLLDLRIRHIGADQNGLLAAELDMLVPAYAATIHKSQGSEYPAVVIPVMAQHYPMLQRNLLYTGVTRGKKLVVLVGQKKAVAIAVRNVSGRRR